MKRKMPENDQYLGQLYSYLNTYQKKYDYTTVFCISEQTGNYYYQDGLNKTISKEDEHDVWYYNFTESGHEYDLEVDTNEANNKNITLFVNFRVEGDDGRLLGVIGVGVQINLIEDMIRSYEKNYDLSAYIINVGASENSFSGNTDIFINEDELAGLTGIKEKVKLNKPDKPEMQWFNSDGDRKCLITKYDKNPRLVFGSGEGHQLDQQCISEEDNQQYSLYDHFACGLHYGHYGRFYQLQPTDCKDRKYG